VKTVKSPHTKVCQVNAPPPQRRNQIKGGGSVADSAPPVKRRVSRLKRTTVLLVDDNAVMRQSLRTLVKADCHSQVIGQARNGREAVKKARTLRPDVILMDISMPVLNGLEATRQILAVNPAAKVIMLSAHSDDAYIERMTAVGARGFLEKQTAMGILGQAIREVAKGNLFFTPAIAKRMASGKNWSHDLDGLATPNGVRLTTREMEVLKLVAKGQANKEVGANLGITVKAVEKHRQSAMDKLKVHETADLTRYVVASGIIESGVRIKIV
jgi:DNA-binding NarL/FixJ family response regulator